MPSSSTWKVALTLVALAAAESAAPSVAAAAAPETPTAPPVTTAAASAPPETPTAPSVDDPMLTPVPQPTRRLHRWEDALVYIKARSTDLRIAEVEITRAEAQWRQALAGSLPTINLNASLSHQIITNKSLQPSTKCTADGSVALCPIETPFPNAANAGITAVQPLVTTRSWYALGTAKQSETVARLNVADVKRQIALRVANGMVAVVTAERIAELNRVGLRNALERLALTQRRAALGSATGLDVVRAQQDAEAARTSLVSGDEALRQSREALGLALGVPEAIGVGTDVRIDGLEQAATSTCKPSSRLEDRPDVASAGASIALAGRALGDAKRQFLPTVNLQSTLSTTSIDTGATPRTTWNIQGLLSIPIWDGGVRYATLRTANVDISRAEQRLEAVRRQATIEITQARRAVEVAESSRAVSQRSRDLAVETDRLVRVGYVEGRGTSLELVAAATTLRQADITLALREFDVVKARVAAVISLSRCEY